MNLRPARFSDATFFGEMLRRKDILKSSGVDRPITQSWFLLWCWLKRKYARLNCIEADSARIGFIGLYNLTRDSGEITLVIFHKERRRLGYGTKAFTLFKQDLPKYLSLRTLVVRVVKDNLSATSFWAKLGFRELQAQDDITVMYMDLQGDSGGTGING